jgi:RNA polymerase sigma factor (sigma-70 family)
VKVQLDIHKDLIELCKIGNPKAQYRLYKLYAKAMYNICYRMMNNREEAEDMLQEAFAETFQKLNTFRYESTFGAWLKRIVVNKCINQLKKNQAELEFTENIYNHQTENSYIDFENIKLNVQRILKAIEKLPDGYRIVFCLYNFEGYDHQEIAMILGISESTSKTQYFRAKSKIKALLTEENEIRQA